MNTLPIPEEVLRTLPKLYATERQNVKRVHLTVYKAYTRWQWYVVEGQKCGDDWELFGYVQSGLGEDCNEWGYFMLSDMNIIEDMFYQEWNNMYINLDGKTTFKNK